MSNFLDGLVSTTSTSSKVAMERCHPVCHGFIRSNPTAANTYAGLVRSSDPASSSPHCSRIGRADGGTTASLACCFRCLRRTTASRACGCRRFQRTAASGHGFMGSASRPPPRSFRLAAAGAASTAHPAAPKIHCEKSFRRLPLFSSQRFAATAFRWSVPMESCGSPPHRSAGRHASGRLSSRARTIGNGGGQRDHHRRGLGPA